MSEVGDPAVNTEGLGNSRRELATSVLGVR